jgi:hypothetical protein
MNLKIGNLVGFGKQAGKLSIVKNGQIRK